MEGQKFLLPSFIKMIFTNITDKAITKIITIQQLVDWNINKTEQEANKYIKEVYIPEHNKK